MGPAFRFAAVLVLVAGFHLGGAWAGPRLALALHGVGTLALGAGIFLAGQIFNLQEHWPGGVLLWALGAWAGAILRRDWVQGALAALLTPLWLGGEWVEATRHGWGLRSGATQILAVGVLGLALVYLTVRRGDESGPLRRALAWIGGLALLPACLMALVVDRRGIWVLDDLSGAQAAFGWGAALGLPLLVALLDRRGRAWISALALLWAAGLSFLDGGHWTAYAWCALGAAALAGWGVLERRRERVDLGVAGFALTLLGFYFSDVMGKLGRSAGLLGLGALFLLGGWQMERLRRRLNARIAGGAS